MKTLRERIKRYHALEEGISGHYFLQYFNVKSFGFLEPSYRFLQEKPRGRSLGERVFRNKQRRRREGREGTVVPHGAFPAMQSLKGEPRHYAMAVVHGPLPHHPFDSSFLHCFSFPPSNFLIVFSLYLSSCPTQLLLFLFHRGESFAIEYTYPNGIRHSPIRSRSNDT